MAHPMWFGDWLRQVVKRFARFKLAEFQCIHLFENSSRAQSCNLFSHVIRIVHRVYLNLCMNFYGLLPTDISNITPTSKHPHSANYKGIESNTKPFRLTHNEIKSG